jgi:CubicO group peptidase (beta-lactamase class C family)
MAQSYAEAKAGDALLIWERGELVVEDYTNGYRADDPHMLASGTKTFTGLMALAAAEDELLSLDEPVAASVPSWAADPQKSQVTIRQLLQLTSGLETGIGRAPSFQEALQTPLVHAPGASFCYGPTAFQVFGAVLAEKLDGQSPETYLNRRLLEPIGAAAPTWGRTDGDINLGGGARTTARNWLRFGRLLLGNGTFEGETVIARDVLTPLITPTDAGPGYGLSVWLNAPVDPDDSFFEYAPPDVAADGPEGMIYADGPNDLFMAAGLFNQRLFVIPSREMVVVRFGRRDRSWHDGEFLARLLDDKAYEAAHEVASNRQDPQQRDRAVAFVVRRQMTALDSTLSLTDAQVESIRPIVQRRTQELFELRQRRASMEPLNRRDKRRLGRALRQLMRETDAAIRSHLTSEQQAAYAAFREEQRETLLQHRNE